MKHGQGRVRRRPRSALQVAGADTACPRLPRARGPPHAKDMATSFTQCLAPSALMASAVPAYGHLPPSSCSWPTVTSTPRSTLAARTGAIQHKLKSEEQGQLRTARADARPGHRGPSPASSEKGAAP